MINAQNLRSALTAILVALAGLPLLAACSAAPPSQETESVGTLASALVTTGSDGASYRFPMGTLLFVGGGNFSDTFLLDGPDPLLTLKLPVGTYGVSVIFPSNAQFQRTSGGATTLVDAVQTDPQPLSVTISQNATASLALHFDVKGLADITFDAGQLAVSAAVTRTTDAQVAGSVIESGSYLMQSINFTAASDAARLALNIAPGEMHPIQFQYGVTGAWMQLSSTMVCAQVAPQSLATDAPTGFSRSISQLVGGSGFACVIDQGAADTLFVNLDRTGTAPADQQAFLPGANYRFFLSLAGTVGDVYDGTTLQQSKLQNSTVLGSAGLAHQIWDNDLNQEVVYSSGAVTGSVRLAL